MLWVFIKIALTGRILVTTNNILLLLLLLIIIIIIIIIIQAVTKIQNFHEKSARSEAMMLLRLKTIVLSDSISMSVSADSSDKEGIWCHNKY